MDDYERAVVLLDEHGEPVDFAGPRPQELIDLA
jgi:hypothetical protein